MATTLTVKLHHGKEIRRFTTDSNDITWVKLTDRMSALFELPSAQKLKVTYLDEENEKITVSSHDELVEAIGLALASSPAILRLTLVTDSSSKKADKADKTAAAPGAKTADKKPECNMEESLGALAPFFQNMMKQLPAAMAMMPEELKQMIPHAELDLGATVAANASKTDAFCRQHPQGAKLGVHEGVSCDKTGQCPIEGNRYHMVGHNYDLCEAEYLKLDEREQALFIKVPPAGAAAAANLMPDATTTTTKNNNVHPGVSCDKTGLCPIVGIRYNLRGHNYDLCQAEFDKLADNEKALYQAIPPPGTAPAAGCGPWRPAGPWARGWGGRGMGCAAGMGGAGGPPKLAARFVRDVSVFDGTQMAPGTPFTKIWRLKNVGEAPWPPGTRMLFVGGDQMTTEMSVPLSHTSAVMPGEEIDVAVEMVAPKELGRYLGYWRLTGPHMRRKFGQRVWCHVQVVDPSASGVEGFEDLQGVMAEIQKKKSDLAADEEAGGEVADDDLLEKEAAVEQPEVADTKKTTVAASPPVNDDAAEVAVKAAAATATTVAATTVAAATMTDDGSKEDGNTSDDGFSLVNAVEAKAAAPAGGKVPMVDVTDPGPSSDGVRGALLAMGFKDDTLIEAVIAKHGDDVDACARDLAAATEWESLLDDLQEMGFADRTLNKTLMLKNAGNMKRTVRDLVEA